MNFVGIQAGDDLPEAGQYGQTANGGCQALAGPGASLRAELDVSRRLDAEKMLLSGSAPNFLVPQVHERQFLYHPGCGFPAHDNGRGQCFVGHGGETERQVDAISNQSQAAGPGSVMGKGGLAGGQPPTQHRRGN